MFLKVIEAGDYLDWLVTISPAKLRNFLTNFTVWVCSEVLLV